MVRGTLRVNSKDILPIVKGKLYSDRERFLGELVSNGCDAIVKFRSLVRSGEAICSDAEDFRVEVSIDKANGSISVSDNGIGMDEQDIERNIVQMAFSSAADFAESCCGGDRIIGQFGLGFFSAFSVSSSVSIDSRSYKDGSIPVRWSCNGSEDYEIVVGEKADRGTVVTLHLDSESLEFLEKETVRRALVKYCRFLHVPTFLDGDRINNVDPLWIKQPSKCSDSDYRSFYSHLFPSELDPVFWVHLNVDYPFFLQGILYFPKLKDRLNAIRSSIQLYSNRVFVSDCPEEILPDFLGGLRGIIDTGDGVPLSVSRSAVQQSSASKKIFDYIVKKVADGLVSYYKSKREEFLLHWPEIDATVKLGILQNEKFYGFVKSCLVWESLSGEWITIDGYVENCSATDRVVYYAHRGKVNSHLLDLYKHKGIDIIFVNSPLDVAVINFCEGKTTGWSFRCVDSSLDGHVIDEAREKNLLDSSGISMGSRLAVLFKDYLPDLDIEVTAKSLSSDTIHALIITPENSQRMQSYFALTGGGRVAETKKSFVINTNSPLVQLVSSMKEKDPDLSKKLACHIYDTSLLHQGQIPPDNLQAFLARDGELLTSLSSRD